jgi:Domain of unknown function (DUF4115)
MLIGAIVAAVVVLALTAALLLRRMNRDDTHSVDGYHRSIHTLETINTHPAVSSAVIEPSLSPASAFPASVVRVGGSPSVRVTDAPSAAVQSVPPPPGTRTETPVVFDDAGPVVLPTHEPVGNRDKAMGSINHRPRRLAAPATAVAVVIVLVVVLLVTGSHTVAPQPGHHSGSNGEHVTSPKGNSGETTAPTTTPTTSPPIAVPQSGTARTATYDVTGSNFTLDFAATSGACWVDVTSSTTGATLFTKTLQPGQQDALAVSGPATVVVGAPTVLGVLVDGSAVALPSGFQTPFTMKFVIAS